MTPERWAQIKEVFTNAAELQEEARAAYIAEACGADEDLRREVESLLREPTDGPGFESPIRDTDMSGRTVSHYRLVEKLGEGGMGEVWKAEDTQLRRTVALKFLPRETLGDEEIKARLIREAQAAAALDHPNICPVYGIHEEGGRTFIAMAYIDGPSLADKIKERPLPLDEALAIVSQVAEALDEAHERGVVHRDIKPQNILLTAKGQVKVLDFGLASLAGRSKLTKTGTTMGTPAYMAPEQVEGKEADRRADLWALGCVLYEMLTQRTPFAAEYQQAISYGILNEEPEPVTAQRAGLPTEIDRLIGKALDKNLAERYQHADDLLADLRRLPKLSVSGSRLSRHADSSGAEAQKQARSVRVWQALLAVAVLLLVGLAMVHFRGPALQVQEFSVLPPEGVNLHEIAVSPDGRFLAATAFPAESLWICDLRTGRWTELEEAGDADGPFWSPDSGEIGYFVGSELRRIGVEGGQYQPIASIPNNRGGSWSGNDEILVASQRSIYLVPASGGAARVAAELQRARFPYWLPGGSRFLVASDNPDGVYIGSADGEAVVPLLDFGSNVAYLGARLFYAHQGLLYARPFDADSLQFTGEQQQLRAVQSGSQHFAFNGFSVSQSGVLALWASRAGVDRRFHWFDRNGNPVERTGAGGRFFTSRLSADGRFMAYGRLGPGLWLYDFDKQTQELVQSAGTAFFPALSPDGSRAVVARSRIQGSAEGLALLALGANSSEKLIFSKSEVVVPSGGSTSRDWSRNGQILFTTSYDYTGELRYLEETPNGVWADHPVGESILARRARFSPNGRYVAYDSLVADRVEIYVVEFPDGKPQLVSRRGGSVPVWSPEGDELFYLDNDGNMTVVEVAKEGPFTWGEPTKLFPTKGSGFGDLDFEVSPDGQRFLFPVSVDSQGEPVHNTPIQVITNWHERFGLG